MSSSRSIKENSNSDLTPEQQEEIEQALASATESIPAEELTEFDPKAIQELVYRYLAHLDRRFEKQTYRRVSEPSRFQASSRPMISICDYYKRIEKYGEIETHAEGIYIIALLIWFQTRTDKHALDAFTMHRTLITCSLVLQKLLCDSHFSNSYFAKIGGVPPEECNVLEVELLCLTGFDFYYLSTPEMYQRTLQFLKAFLDAKDAKIESDPISEKYLQDLARLGPSRLKPIDACCNDKPIYYPTKTTSTDETETNTNQHRHNTVPDKRVLADITRSNSKDNIKDNIQALATNSPELKKTKIDPTLGNGIFTSQTYQQQTVDPSNHKLQRSTDDTHGLNSL